MVICGARERPTSREPEGCHGARAHDGGDPMAGLGNITENANVGLLFVDFFRDVIGLHVNGAAKVVEDAAMRIAYRDLAVDPVPGRRPERWVTVHVEEAYIHCAKHIRGCSS